VKKAKLLVSDKLHKPVIHKGETVDDFKARGGKIKKLPPGVADWSIGFTKQWK